MLLPFVSQGQNILEVILPEGIGNVYNPEVVVNQDRSQAIFSHYDSNKLFVWNLERNDLDYTINLSKTVRYTQYHPEKPVYFASTEDSVFVYDSKSGKNITGVKGRNRLPKGIVPFKDETFIYTHNDSVKIVNFSTGALVGSFATGEISSLYSAGFVPGREEIVIDHEGGFSIFKAPSEITTFLNSDLSPDEMVFEDNRITLKKELPRQYKVYDRKTSKVLHELEIDPDQFLAEGAGRVYLKNEDYIIVKNVLTNMELEKVKHPFNYINEASLNANKNELVVFGEVDNQNQFRIYDLQKGQFKDLFSRNDEITSYSNYSFFSNDGKYINRIYEDRIQINSVLTGMLIDVFPAEDSFLFTTYPFEPQVLEERNLLVLARHQVDQTEKLMSINLITGTVNWIKNLPDNTEYIRINRGFNTIEHKSGFKKFENDESGAVVSFISTEDGKTLYESDDLMYPASSYFQISEEEIIKVSSVTSIDENSLRIDIHNFADGSERTEVVEANEKSSFDTYSLFDNTLLAQNAEELVLIKFRNSLKIDDSIKIESKFEAIDFLEREQILVLKEKYKPAGEVRFIDLRTKKPLFTDLNLLHYRSTDHRALVKDMEGRLFQVTLPYQKLIATGEQLEEDSETKLFDEHYLLFSRNDSLILFDARKNRTVESFEGYFDDVEDISPGGHLYLENFSLHKTRDAGLYQELKDAIELPDHLWDFAVSPGNESLLFFDQYNGILNRYNPGNGKLEKHVVFPEYDNSRKESMEFLNDQTLFVTDLRSSFDAVREQHFIFDVNSGKTTNITGQVDEFETFKVYDKNILILNSRQTVRVFNLTTGENVENLQAYSSWYSEEKQLLFSDNSETISLYNVALAKPEWEVNIPRSYHTSFFGGIIDEKLVLVNDNKLLALNLQTGEVEAETVIGKNFQDSFSHISVFESSIFINEGTVFEPQMQRYVIKNDSIVKENISDTGKSVTEIESENSITENDLYMLEDDILIVYYLSKKRILIKNFTSEEVLFEGDLDISSIELEFSLNAEKKNLFLSNSDGEVAFINFGEHPRMESYNLKGKGFQLKNGLVYANDHGQKVDVYGLKDQELKYSILPIKQENYIIYTPAGYYFSTKEAAEYLKFKLNNNYYSFDQFDLVFNRPHEVLKAMGSGNKGLVEAYGKAYQKRVERQDYAISSAIDEIPVVKLLNKNEIPKAIEQPFVEINIAAEAKSNMLDRLFVKVNGNQVEELELNQQKYSSALQLDLNKGSNVIEVFAVNQNGLKSLTERLSLVHEPVAPKESKTFFIGIGVSEYQNKDYNLKYAAKDIKDLSVTLKERYPDIVIDTLLNENVTLPNILQLKERLNKADVNDLVIISFCGHGVLDDDLNWYFGTSDMDFDDPAGKGLPYDLLESLTTGVRARQKLVTIDACHSGEIDTEEIKGSEEVSVEGNVKGFARGSKVVQSKNKSKSTYALMKELFSDIESGNGTVVISASGGMEFAFETKEYQNGVFTYSLMKKLDESIWNSLNVSELQDHVISEVFKLTDGMQRPTIRAGNLASDWVVW